MTTLPQSPAISHIRPVRMLLVDDSASVRHELAHLLDLSGMVHIIGEAADGLEAVRLAADLSPEVVLMDLEMPGLDGFDTTRQIKAGQPAPRVVILSAHGKPEDQERARAAGADGFVVKGASYQTLLTAILEKDGSTISFEKGE